MAKKPKQTKTPGTGPTHTIIRPTKASAAVAAAVSGRVPAPLVIQKSKAPPMHWQMIDDLSYEIGNSIATMATSINDSVAMVRSMGCDHPDEFNILVKKTNEDLQRFADDFNRVKAQHAGKSGEILDANDNALSITVFENYLQFRALFDGTMHHSLISFTEYALEAKDRANAILKAAEASEPATATPEVQPTTEAAQS